jgi:hypothetical protein
MKKFFSILVTFVAISSVSLVSFTKAEEVGDIGTAAFYTHWTYQVIENSEAVLAQTSSDAEALKPTGPYPLDILFIGIDEYEHLKTENAMFSRYVDDLVLSMSQDLALFEAAINTYRMNNRGEMPSSWSDLDAYYYTNPVMDLYKTARIIEDLLKEYPRGFNK